MILDKGLIIKGIAGVAAVAGVGSGIVFKDQIKSAFSSSSQGNATPQPTTENTTVDTLQQEAANTSQNHSTPQEQDTVKTGDTGSQLRTDNQNGVIVSGGSLSSAPTEDDYGIPTKCKTTSPCDLSQDELKKIKFEALGDEDTPEVKVEGFPSDGKHKITLKIDSTESNKKRYIFNNPSSSPITIKKGTDSQKTVTLGSGRTKFTLDADNKKLKQFTLNDYGLPKEGCESTCTLTYTDLEDIKFDGLDGVLSVTPTNKTVTLKIDSSDTTNKRFTFENSGSQITIKNGGSASITLSAGKNRFKDNSGKLKKIELDDKGIPRDCSNTCTLTEDDLKEIKFSDFDNQTGNITVEPKNQTISLTITKGDDYDFNNGSSQPITIKKGNASVELTQETGTPFHIKDGKLVKGKKKTEAEIFNEKIKNAGFPCGHGSNGCCKFQDGNTSGEIECKLNKDKFKVLKFKDLGGGEVDTNNLSAFNDGNFKVKIKKIKPEEKGNYSSGTDLKFIFDGFNGQLTIQGAKNKSNNFYLRSGTDTEFIVNSSGQLEKAWTRQSLGEKIGLSCGSSGYECSVKGPINLITSGNSKYEGMTKSGSGDAKFEVALTSEYREGFGFRVKDNDIILTKEGQSQTLTTGHCYQAKWDTDNKWWLAYKAASCSG